MSQSSRSNSKKAHRISPYFLKRLSTYLVLATSLTLAAAETLYKTDSGPNTVLDTANTTPTAPGAIVQNYSEGTSFTAADSIFFNNLITAATTFRVSATAATNLQVANITMLDPAGAVTISNTDGQTQTVTIGGGGINLGNSTQSLTFASSGTTGTVTVATSAPQTWTLRTGKTLSLAAAPVTLSDNVTVQGAGTVLLGNSTAGNSITGVGSLLIDGAQSGGTTVVTLSGTNPGWTGATAVGSSSPLRTGVTLNLDQSAASQNKLADTAPLSINHSTVNLQGTSAGTEVVASVALGQGLNQITRSAGTGVLQMNVITRVTGAVLNLGAASIATTDTLNVNGILGGWAVINISDWAINSTGAADGAITAFTAYTDRTGAWTSPGATANVRLTGAVTAVGNDTINSLKINGAFNLTQTGGTTLNIVSGGILKNVAGDNTISGGTITAGGLANNVADELYVWNNQATMNISSVIADNFDGVAATTDVVSLTKSGAGTLTILADNTYTGGTTVAAGALNIGNNNAAADNADLGSGAIVNHGAITISKTTGATLTQGTIANNITGTGSFATNRGTVTLSGVNDYTGVTTVAAALASTLRAGSAAGFSANSRMILSGANTATVELNSFDVSVAALSGTQTAANVALGANTLTLSGSDLANSGSAEILSLTPQAYQGGFTGTGNLIKNGNYTQVFTAGGVADYTGSTTVNGGILQTNKAMASTALTVSHTANAFGINSTFLSNVANSLGATAAVNLTNAGATWQIGNGFSQSIGSLAGATDSRVNFGTGPGNAIVTINDNGGTPTVFNGIIGVTPGAGTTSVVKDGANTWVLGGGNSYTGSTTINGGILQFAANSPIGILSDVTAVLLANAATAAWDINGNTSTVGSLAGGGGTGGNVTLGAAGRLFVGVNNTSTNYAGTISGGAAGGENLVKVGNGTMTLSGTNTFLGDVLIRRGTGGLTLSGGSALLDTANIRNFGNGSTLTITNSETVAAVTGAQGTKLVLGAGATLTTTYTDGNPVVGAATADVDPLAGRVVKDINTANLSAGMLISGGTIPAGSYIVQILDGNSVLINAVPATLTTNFAPTTVATSVLGSEISGTGGFTKNGAGTLFMTGNSTYSGDTTINDGTVQIGGIWTGARFSIQDQLSDSSQFVFASSGTQNLNFANSATNLTQFERIGSLAGGSVNTTVNLSAGSNVGALAFGGDNKSSTYSGNFLPSSSAGILLKEGTGTFTWNNPVANTFDGLIIVDAGGFTITGANGLDGANSLLLQNNGTTFTTNVGVADTFAILQGGGKGASRVLPSGVVGGLMANYIGGTDAIIDLTSTAGVRLQTSTTTSSVFGGTITGAGIFQKDGTSTLELRGINSGTHQVIVTAGILRMGAYGAATGVGTPGVGGFGALATGGSIRVTGGTLELNNSTQTTTGFGASSSGGVVAFGNGSLTLSNQTAQTVVTTFTGNFDAVLNVNGSAALALTGNNTTYGGTINLGTGVTLNLNRAGGAINSTGTNLARINLATGSTLLVTLADTIGGLSGAGGVTLTTGLTVNSSGSTVASGQYSGTTTGASSLTILDGSLKISGASNHTGGTILTRGRLVLDYTTGATNLIANTGALTLAGGTLIVSGGSAIDNAASTTLTAGASVVMADPTLPSSAIVNLAAITRTVAGSTLQIGGTSAATSTANVNGILGGYAVYGSGRVATDWAAANGPTSAINGLAAASYTADTWAPAAHTNVVAGIAGATGATGDVRFNTAAANTVALGGAATITSGGILVTSNVGLNLSSIVGGGNTLTSGAMDLIVHQHNVEGNLLINVDITGAIGLTKAGRGTVILGQNNTFNGAVTIGQGTLQVGTGGTTGNLGVGTVAITNNGVLTFNRSNALTVGNVLQGDGRLIKEGAGALTIGNATTASNYTGLTSVQAGSLIITRDTALGAVFGLTSVENGAQLDLGAGTDLLGSATVAEIIALKGGTLRDNTTIAAQTILSQPIFLLGSAANANNTISTVLTGDELRITGQVLGNIDTDPGTVGLQAANLVMGGAGIVTLENAANQNFGSTTINSGATLQVGRNTAGMLGGRGNVINNGNLILNANDSNYIIGNAVSGTGNLTLVRNTAYLTADNSYSGTTTIGSTTQNAALRIGNDTYTGSLGTGAVTVQSSTAGNSAIRFHLNQDYDIANTVTLNPNSDGTTARNADFVKEGLGTLTFTGTLNGGAHVPAPGTQRALITANSKMIFAGTLNAPVGSEVNINNNLAFAFAGSVSNTWNGVLGGNNPWIFRNSGTTTLAGNNTFNTASYVDLGTVTLTGGVASHDDNDWYIQNGATLAIATTETIGSLFGMKGSTVSVALGQTLTFDDTFTAPTTNVMNGAFTGAGNVTVTGGAFLSTQGSLSTISGNLNVSNGTVRSNNLTNAFGSFTNVNLGSGTTAGNLEYIGRGETFAENLNLTGAATGNARITASGTGALILSGNISSTSTGAKTLFLTGQTGGGTTATAIINRVDGAITEGTGVLSLSMPATANDDRFGVTGRWALTNKNNDFSGGITVNVGQIEIGGILNDGGAGLGGLGNGTGVTSSMGDLTAIRTIDLGTNNYDGRRYDAFGSGDQLGAVATGTPTNTLTPNGSIGTIIFNDPNAGIATLGANITFTQSFSSTTNPGGGQIRNIGAKQIVINGTLTSGANGNRVWTLDGTNTLTNTIGGIISNGGGTGQTVGVTKEGAGTWRLTNTANTFTGTITVTRGTLEVSGGGAIPDGNTVAVTGVGSDGSAVGQAIFRVVGSENIGLLTGNIGTLATIDAGQTLTIVAGAAGTFNGVIAGSGNLTRSVTSSVAGSTVTSDKNTYTGVTSIGSTGAATASGTLIIYQLANGLIASGLGASSNAASNLVFFSNTANNQGGVLGWQGFTNQSTDRLFTMGLGAVAARINAIGTVIGTTAPTMTFSNTGAIVFTGSGTRTLTLGGATIAENVFRPQITDGGGATSLSKVDAGLWLINPDIAGNTYTGGTTIAGGTIAIRAGNALGSGTISITGGTPTGLEIRNGITVANNLANTGGDGGIFAASGTNVMSGTVSTTVNFRVAAASGASLQFTNTFSGAGQLIKLGDGTLTLSGTNTNTGAAFVRDGILRLDYATNNTTKLGDAVALNLGGIAGHGVPGVDNNVGGQNNTFGQGGGTIELSGGSHLELVSATTIDTGSNAVTRSTGAAVLRMNAITRGVNQGTIDFGASGIADTDTTNTAGILGTTTTGAFATVGKTDWAFNSTNAVDGAISALASYATDYGSGNNTNITLAAANTGTATLNNTFRFNANQATTLTLGAPFGVQGTAVGLQAGGILVTPNVGAFTTIIDGAPLQNAASTVNFATIVHQHNTLGALQIDSVIQNNTLATAQGLTKTGAGKLFLNALNTYSGVVNLFEGEIQVGGTAAAPTVATNAYLSGVAVGTGNASSAWNLAAGTTLRFLTTNTTVYNTPVISGDGHIILDTGNSGVLLFDDDNSGYYGELTLNGGTIQISGNDNALGNVRNVFNINNAPNIQFNSARSITKVTNYSEGTTLNILGTSSTGAFAGKQNFNNTTTAGLAFNVAAPTTAGVIGLNLTGVVYGSNGFTKTGNGILQLSGVNFADVYDGFTGANKTATLNGQIAVNQGLLYVGGTRALGAFGVGNETVVASGATVDLRDADLNLGDDSDPSREIFKISGTGVSGTGALRNTAGTALFSFLTLSANATISNGGFANGSRLDLSTFDTNLNNGSTLAGNFIRNRPVIVGGGFDLTIRSSTNGQATVFHDPSFSTALRSIIVSEGVLRFEQDVAPLSTWTGLTAAEITGGITLAYSGPSLGDYTNAALGNAPIVGSRLNFFRNSDLHHTVAITMDGVTTGANGGKNIIDIGSDTIPGVRTFLDGGITLLGNAADNIIQSEAGGNFSVQEQGNLTVGIRAKLIIGSAIVGTGGFSKTGFGETRLTADNTFTGDLNILRFGTTAAPWQSNTVQINGVNYATYGDAEGWNEWGLTLSGVNGAVSGTTNINLQRRGMLTLDNTSRLDLTSGGTTGGNNNDRVNNAATINWNDGWLRINGGTVNNTEAFGTFNVQSGTNIVDLYPTNGAGTNMTATIAQINRSAGSVLRIQNLDATSTFSTAAVGESVRVALTTATGLTQVGGGGVAGTTNRNIVIGVFGGNVPYDLLNDDLRLLGANNGNVTDLANQQRNLQQLAGSHFMTYDGGFLRPLDDSEYYVATGDGLINASNGAGQNVSINGINTLANGSTSVNSLRFGPVMDHNGSGGGINSSTTLTNQNDHHVVSLYVDGTLGITSGMISSAYFSLGNSSASSSIFTTIQGGSLDFGAREAIINNQNGVLTTPTGTISTGNLEIRSNIIGTGGLLKTGLAAVILDGQNTYTGLTTINDGTLLLRNGRTAAGAGGIGNGIVITGNGNLSSGNGIQVGTAAAREDIYVGVLAGDQQIMRVDNDVTNWFSNVTIDNVDISGLVIGTPRIRTDNSATSILNGNLFGGNTPITNDVSATDPRRVTLQGAGNNVFIVRGQIGDKGDSNGNAIPIADTISTLPTLAGTRTNENEVLRVDLGGTFETNYMLERQYNAAGRLSLEQGNLIIKYDPTALSNDGAGFWTNTALSRIPTADSTTTSFAVNSGTAFQGFTLGTNVGSATNNGAVALFLTRSGQAFNLASFSTLGTGTTKFIGGLNESGTVTFGDGTGALTHNSTASQLHAASGGRVVFNQVMLGSPGTAPANLGFIKTGRGTVELQSSIANTASTSTFELGGGTLILNHDGGTGARVSNANSTFSGGSLIALASTTVASTAAISTSDAANVLLRYQLGNTEIVARTTNTGTARNMTVNLGNQNANGTTSTSNFTRALGATGNFVEDSVAGGVAQITMNFNAMSTAAVKNASIPWATYGTAARTATDFAMVDNGAGNDVRAFGRAADEYLNAVGTWAAGMDVSENGGAGFNGMLAGSLSVNTIRFDAAADSVLDLGANVLTVSGPALAQSAGAILVSSNVGSANKTITGTAGSGLTTSSGSAELIFHQYSTGNLNVNAAITGAINVTIAGPSSVDASTIGTTGAVVLSGTNTYNGRTFITGAALNFSDVNALGVNPGASTADRITFNGGTLRFTGRGYVDMSNRGFRFEGSGGTIDVVEASATLRTDSIASQGTYRGDLVKIGAGTLGLEGTNGDNASFGGLIDVREGTLRVNADNTTTTSTSAITSLVLGTSNSYADGTIFRTGTNFAIQMGNRNDSSDWNLDEWITFEGDNYVTVGTINTQTAVQPAGFPNPNNERPINLNGIITINGATTFDVVPGQTLRFNNGGVGYIAGAGDLIKDGQGTMDIRGHIPDFTGNIIVKQGRLVGYGQADIFGTGYLTGKTVTLGSADRQGIAEFVVNSESAVHGWTIEINHDINVVYNPVQTKRLTVETVANGMLINLNGDITLNDNLIVYMNDAAEVGGSQNYVNINGQFKDGTVTSGNITFQGDDTGSANDNTTGRPYNYAVLKADNSLWTGDVHVSANTGYDQDQTTIVRLEHAKALGAANDVTLNFNSILQVGGGTRTIGSLTTNGGNGAFYGDTGTMSAQTNGSTEIIENAAATAGTLTIVQSTPAAVEVAWDAKFRDGRLNSQFFAPNTSTQPASAALNVEKAGAGWATVTLDNDYTGTTTIFGGNLQVGRGGVGDTGANNNAGGIFVGISGTLSGTGTVQGNATGFTGHQINGNVRPGDAAGAVMGTLTFTGNTILNTTAVLTLQIQRATFNVSALTSDSATYTTDRDSLPTTYAAMLNDTVLTTQHDKIIVSAGTLTAGFGGAKFTIENNGYTPMMGDVFNLLDWTGGTLATNVGLTFRNGGETGTDLDLPLLGTGYQWDTSLFASQGILVVVPEPNSLAMLASSLGLALGLQRFRRRRTF